MAEIDEAELVVIGAVVRESGTEIVAHPDVMSGVMMTDRLGETGICSKIAEVVLVEDAEGIVIRDLDNSLDRVGIAPRAQLLRPRKRSPHQI